MSTVKMFTDGLYVFSIIVWNSIMVSDKIYVPEKRRLEKWKTKFLT